MQSARDTSQHLNRSKGAQDAKECQPISAQVRQQRSDGQQLGIDTQPQLPHGLQRQLKRKVSTLTIDLQTELPANDLIEWRDQYIAIMRDRRASQTNRRSKAIAEANARYFVHQYTHSFMRTGLFEFYTQQSTSNYQTVLAAELKYDLETARGYSRQSERNTREYAMSEDVELGRGNNESDFMIDRSSMFPWNLTEEGSIARSMASHSQPSKSVQGTPRHFSFMHNPTISSRNINIDNDFEGQLLEHPLLEDDLEIQNEQLECMYM